MTGGRRGIPLGVRAASWTGTGRPPRVAVIAHGCRVAGDFPRVSKMKCAYPAVILRDEGKVQFPDFPEIAGTLPAGTETDKAIKALLEGAIRRRMEKRQSVPFPSLPRDKDTLVWTSRKLGHDLTQYWEGTYVPPPARRKRSPRKRPAATAGA